MSKSLTADRHKRHPATVRLAEADRAWFAERAASLGISPHALMVRALGDYRAAHSLAPIAEYAAAPAEPLELEAAGQ